MKKKKNKVVGLTGILINDVLFYYEDSEDFMDAWPGIKLWLGVEKGNKKIKYK